MTHFIEDVLDDLIEKNTNFSELVIILPSKRAGVFFKHHLSQKLKETIFSPEILSIETFVENLSQLKQATNLELLFRLYDSYQALTKKEDLESFDSFAKWAQILLQDFNEIDRHLIPQAQIFEYLSAIQELNHWSLQEHQTDFIKNYLSFWNKLKQYYNHFTDALLQSGIGYQGIIYREAVEHLESYIQNNSKTHVFVGFNALNTAEETIIKELLHNDVANIYWDIDKTFIDDPIHDAGLFLRKHRDSWQYFSNHPFNWIGSSYTERKNIHAIGASKLVGQAKSIGVILDELIREGSDLSNTAVILGEEELLIPVLNSLPKEITALNITMGLPLKSIPLVSLFEKLFLIHKKSDTSYYYKDVISILSHPLIHMIFDDESGNCAARIIEHIQLNNIIYMSVGDLRSIVKNHHNTLNLLFENWENNIDNILKTCSTIIFKIKAELDIEKSKNLLELEYLYRINVLFNQISELNSKYDYIKDVASLLLVYKELLSNETLDFKGEPLNGLQIMGMLESRVLDFETVIIASVNEGILPSGKSHNSFIPFDVKKENELPTYKEKDAVYTYHFYRLLQRAKNAYILYNTEVDSLKGGEKSRFITQLEVEGIHNMNHKYVIPKVPQIERKQQSVKKTKAVLERLEVIAEKGFSPSSLTNYIRNPIDFYLEKVLGVKTDDDVEETVAANTLGSVIHNTLEEFYTPFIGKALTVTELKQLIPKIEVTVTHHFEDIYKKGELKKGKNLIIFEIAKRYIYNFLTLEIAALEEGHRIEIVTIETESRVPIQIPELGFDIYLTGKVDRLDLFNGTPRVIDYKTGKVTQNQVEIVDWDDIITDYSKYSKPFQLLTYAYMLSKKQQLELPAEAGIISFKNLNQGVLKFSQKPSAYSRTKDSIITEDTLKAFENQLKHLIKEICDPNIAFTEKDID